MVYFEIHICIVIQYSEIYVLYFRLYILEYTNLTFSVLE